MLIQDCLKAVPAFAGLENTSRDALQAELQPVTLPAGATLFHQGDPGDALYIVTHGRLRVIARQVDGQETYLEEIGPGQCVGELALLTGQPRVASVIADEDTQLARLSRPDFERLGETHPHILEEFACQMQPRIQRAQLSGILTALFGRLDAPALHSLQERLEWLCLASGDVLFRQGEPGETMYIIVQGRLRLSSHSPDGTEHILGEAGPGEGIGEFALLAERGTPDSLRSATVTAVRTTNVVCLTRATFDDLLCQYPQMMLYITRRIAQRQRRITLAAPLESAALGVALLPLTPGLPVEAFAHGLTTAFNSLGPALSLDRQRFDDHYGKSGAADAPLQHATSLMIDAWLSGLESRYRFIVYSVDQPLQGESALTSWAERCLQAADVVLLLGQAGGDPNPGVVDAALLFARPHARLELALIQPDTLDRPCATLDWLAPRQNGSLPLSAHHHVRLGQSSDFRRLARRLSGRSIGLVLSGGGARGWAHIGVIRALEEAGYEADLVAGASMGSLIGAAYALGMGIEQLDTLATQFGSPKKLLDYTLPVVSLVATRKITALLQDLCGAAGIEDTWREYFCVSTNLGRGQETIHRQGPLWWALRASMAFPAVFAPMLDENGDVLIDGGAVNNLPVDLMRQVVGAHGLVIGVDACPPNPPRRFEFGPSVSGWQVLLQRATSPSKTISAPTILDIVAGVVDTNSRSKLAQVQHLADLLIQPPVAPFGLLEFGSYAPIIEAGYQHTRQVLADWQPPVEWKGN